MEVLSRSIGRGRSNFVGFSSERIDHMFLQTDAIMDGREPHVEILTDCVYLPRRHALYTLAGQRIDASSPTFLEGDIRSVPSQIAKLERENQEKCPEQLPIPEKLERCDMPMLLMGTIIPHFGHFITDSMSRLWMLDHAPKDIPLLCLGTVRSLSREYERVVAQALGLADRLIAPIEPTLFRQVLCPYPAIQLARRVYGCCDGPHRLVGEILGRVGPTRNFSRPIYLSRSGLGAGHRGLEGEELLESQLAQAGYEIIHPETMPFVRQVALFQSGVPIVGAIGSAFHSLLFRSGKQPARLAVLSDNYVHQRFLLQDALKPVETTYLNCMSHVSAAEALRPLNEQKLKIDVPLALSMLKEAGFL